jgi:hypothetical protein
MKARNAMSKKKAQAPPKRLVQEKERLTKLRIRAAWRYFDSWCQNLQRKPKVETVPELERWLAKRLGYSSHNTVNNVLHCNGNFDIPRIERMTEKLARRLNPGDSMVRLNVFLAENNAWYTDYYQANVVNAGSQSRIEGEKTARVRKRDSRRKVRLRKREPLVVLQASRDLKLKSAKVKIVGVARGGKEIIVELQYM